MQGTVEELYLTDVVEILTAPPPQDVPPQYRANVSTSLRRPR